MARGGGLRDQRPFGMGGQTGACTRIIRDARARILPELKAGRTFGNCWPGGDERLSGIVGQADTRADRPGIAGRGFICACLPLKARRVSR